MENNNNALSAMDERAVLTAYGRVFLAANFVGASVVSAFFTSLEQCSCINLSTSDIDSDDDDDESVVSSERRFMFTNSTRRGLPAALPSTTAPSTSVESLPV